MSSVREAAFPSGGGTDKWCAQVQRRGADAVFLNADDFRRSGQMVQIGLRGMQRDEGDKFKGFELGQIRSGSAQLRNQVGLGGFDFETLLTGRVFWNRAFGCKGHAQADDHGH